ncbi:MAG: response regulator transcription factor [Ardenticatenaceae bacterium]|nr:response regulator transcription factor [Ardenticatenaceae bacterium]MCB9445759.1 response regulator transcription factor [Ardenticatenaceae bacterium]
MKILIAEDDLVSRHLLYTKLSQWGYEVIVSQDGDEAWQLLQQEDAPQLAILDWMMPGIDGIDICRRARSNSQLQSVYFILLTTRNNPQDIIEGLQAGADDYVTKPFESQELKARVQAGARIVHLQSELTARVKELESALAKVKQLEGILPICSYCKKIRDDTDNWHQLEKYVTEHSEAAFSHSICPDCYEKYVQTQLDQLRSQF